MRDSELEKESDFHDEIMLKKRGKQVCAIRGIVLGITYANLVQQSHCQQLQNLQHGCWLARLSSTGYLDRTKS